MKHPVAGGARATRERERKGGRERRESRREGEVEESERNIRNRDGKTDVPRAHGGVRARGRGGGGRGAAREGRQRRRRIRPGGRR